MFHVKILSPFAPYAFSLLLIVILKGWSFLYKHKSLQLNRSQITASYIVHTSVRVLPNDILVN